MMSSEPTVMGRRLLEVLVEDPRGHSDPEGAAYELQTTVQGVGRAMKGLSGRGLAYISRFGKEDEYWPTDLGRALLGKSKQSKIERLTVLSFGGGQDSTAILYRLLVDEDFRRQYAPGDLVAVMSDTGDEHPPTYEHVRFCQGLATAHGTELYFLEAGGEYHSDAWRALREVYHRTKTCGSKAFRKSCTDNLKIRPIYRWLQKYLVDRYDVRSWGKARAKQPLYDFAEKNTKIDVLIGIAAGEEKRVAGDEGAPLWMQRTIRRVYPLIDLGWDRAACQKYCRELGLPIPMPSNCMLCPFMSEIELLWLERNYPKDFAEWVRIEAAKLKRFKHVERNLGVFGKRRLPQVLAEAKIKYGHMTDEEIDEYKMSHGHCVATRY